MEMGHKEFPVRSGIANIYYGVRLLLTNQRLIFCTHALSLNLYWDIHLADVDRAVLGVNLLISQRMKMFDREGTETTFIVYGGKTWLAEIEGAIKRK